MIASTEVPGDQPVPPVRRGRRASGGRRSSRSYSSSTEIARGPPVLVSSVCATDERLRPNGELRHEGRAAARRRPTGRGRRGRARRRSAPLVPPALRKYSPEARSERLHPDPQHRRPRAPRRLAGPIGRPPEVGPVEAVDDLPPVLRRARERADRRAAGEVPGPQPAGLVRGAGVVGQAAEEIGVGGVDEALLVGDVRALRARARPPSNSGLSPRIACTAWLVAKVVTPNSSPGAAMWPSAACSPRSQSAGSA